MYYVYIIQNPKGILYKGSTDSVANRLWQYNSGEFPSYTKNKGSWELVYKELFATRKEAEAREKSLKTGKGRKFLKEVIKL
ncbi:MAG: hypothetical protein COT91_04735 [Candidatus Doudnabacteria bacterium CG10_big_fil_rev_8_21_14_0_10_41_10]|uniref:GIY-YIG domain-containing protein n=1 Tax=Candidatus Doudnabacteria bacterium CG10_big_fil_rev_8_21_14_0_10_41_10 TaxID=1974551 RepID=A0A2H0VCD6_9BACT|nr:MAG: hypothetical protein COT91_04735 [Candidatus Doudnabacteria bacterium CG10_big_fil_rev_8_21_14_0_10_41_10]